MPRRPTLLCRRVALLEDLQRFTLLAEPPWHGKDAQTRLSVGRLGVLRQKGWIYCLLEEKRNENRGESPEIDGHPGSS